MSKSGLIWGNKNGFWSHFVPEFGLYFGMGKQKWLGQLFQILLFMFVFWYVWQQKTG